MSKFCRMRLMPSNAVDGFSDETLEALSNPSRFERGVAPWAAWESENCSFGKTFRKWARYPAALPLCVSSDHAVHWESRCYSNEVGSPYNIFFSWNKKKCNRMSAQYGKSAYYVQHPWIHYRCEYIGTPPLNRRGTLAFYAHSNDLTTPVYKNFEAYISNLLALPEKFHPIVFCLSFHDIKKGLHKKLRSYGIPIVTAGGTSSQYFVDRFYSLIYQFRYATSPNIGSHTFYLIESGIPFFILGDQPEYNVRGADHIQDGIAQLSDYGDKDDVERLNYLRSLLLRPCDTVTLEQLDIVRGYMGCDSKISRTRMSIMLWGSLFVNFHRVCYLYFRDVVKVVGYILKRGN